MTADQIADFIEEVIDLGFDPIAVGDDAWLVGDADLPEEVTLSLYPAFKAIEERYGDRDHLHFEIIDHLHSIGRVFVFDTQRAH